MLSSKIRTLRRWYRGLSGPISLYRAIRLYRAGRRDDPATARPQVIRARGLPLDLYCRTGTSDFIVFQELFLEEEYAFARQMVAPPVRWVIDLGGNVGFAAAYLYRLWPDARFVIVEPDPTNCATARRTLRPLINASRAHIHQAFIGARPRLVEIARGGAGGSNELRMGSERSTDLPAVPHSTTPPPDADAATVLTLPDLLQGHGIDRVDFLKCDIEGAEGELFEDCAHWIRSVRHMAVELHDGRSVDWLIGEIARNGGDFQPARVEPNPAPDVQLVWLRNSRR